MNNARGFRNAFPQQSYKVYLTEKFLKFSCISMRVFDIENFATSIILPEWKGNFIPIVVLSECPFINLNNVIYSVL